MLSVMQDDNLLVYGSGAQRDRALDVMSTLGVDAVRATVLWQAVAPHRKPRRSTASPRAYPHNNWNRYDDLVRAAQARGIQVYFSVTGPGPAWAHAKTRNRANRRTWKPNAKEWGQFMRALGTRYSGEYRDEDGDRGNLPRVEWWGVYNEPNQGGWLTPQSQKIRGLRGNTPMSPVIYRDLLYEGVRALVSTDHQGDVILVGETAPLGASRHDERKPIRPAEFIRELFCLDKRGRRYRGRAARARKCDRVRRLSVLKRLPRVAFGHHPYTKDLPPTQRDSHRDSISIANIKDLPTLLDLVARRTRVIKDDMPVYLTEFGYESNPPDPINGVTQVEQAEWLNIGDYIAYRNDRILANTQFQLLDVPPQDRYEVNSRQYWFTYQSGLYTHDGQPKLAAPAYAMPFEARDAGGGAYLFWGQTRFAPNGSAQTVHLQVKDAFGNWVTAASVPVNSAMGYWTQTLSAFAGQTWRTLWIAPDGTTTRTSREITLK
jgi:hypothetical protein